MNDMAWMMKVEPSKYQGQRIGTSSKAQDSSFYILVIQDNIEFIGKANTIKEG
jgi:hypothetical protein